MTGGNIPGIAAEASMILRTRSSRRGWPLAAIAPMFQMASLPVSRLVVEISSSRPFSYSSPMRSRILMSRYLAIDCSRGPLSIRASLFTADSRKRLPETTSAACVSV